MSFKIFIEKVKNITSNKNTESTKTEGNKKSEQSVFSSQTDYNSFSFDSIQELENEFIKAYEELSSIEEDEEEQEKIEESKEIEEQQNISETNEILDIAKDVSVGDVFEVSGQKNAYIKTGDGKYEKLDISIETYQKLFGQMDDLSSSEEKNARLGTEIQAPSTSDSMKSNNLGDRLLLEIWENEDTRYNLLKLLSEDNGAVFVNIPNSPSSSFGLYLDNLGSTNTNEYSGLELISKAFNHTWQEIHISKSEEELEFVEEIISKELKNFSPEFIEKTEEIFQYAMKNEIDSSVINEALYLLSEDVAPEKILLEDSILQQMIANFPAEELNEENLDYIYEIEYKVFLQNEIIRLKETPLETSIMLEFFEKEPFLSSFGIDKKGNPISEESFELATKFIEYSKFPENFEYNTNLIAYYLNDNPYGEEILNTVMKNEYLNYPPSEIILLLEKGFSKDVDIDFLTKAASLNWSPQKIFKDNFINPSNIDLAISYNNYSENENKYITLKNFKAAITYMDSDKLLEIMQSVPSSLLEETLDSIKNIIPNYQNDGTIRSNLLKQDIDLVLESLIYGKDITSLVVPTCTSLNEAMQSFNVGDIFELEGEDFIYIKTENGKYEQLQISKETYMKLFPPVQRYMSKQGEIGDCYLVSSLNNMMTDPTMRHIILQSFSEDEDGNIIVDIPNARFSKKFNIDEPIIANLPEQMDLIDESPNGTRPVNSEFLISESSLGLQMLEYAYGIHLKDEEVASLTEQQYDLILEISRFDLEEYSMARELSSLLDDEYLTRHTSSHVLEPFLAKYLQAKSENDESIQQEIIKEIFINPPVDFVNKFDSIMSQYLNEDISFSPVWTLLELDTITAELETIDSEIYATELRDQGGQMKHVFSAFGLNADSASLYMENEIYFDSDEEIFDNTQLTELLNNQNVKIVSGGTKTNVENEDLNIYGQHAYTIYPIKQENGEYLFEIINPWNEDKTSLLTPDDIERYFYSIHYILLN